MKIKLIKIMMVCIIFGSSIIFSYQPKASANSFVDMPGYVDELFEGVMTGAMTVGGAAAHGSQTFEENLVGLKDTAKTLWDSYSPQMKEAFKNGLTMTADGIIVAGNWIEDFLGALSTTTGTSDATKPTMSSSVSATFDKTVTFQRDNGSKFTVDRWTIKFNKYGSSIYLAIMSGSMTMQEYQYCVGCSVPDLTNTNVSQALSYAMSAGFGVTLDGVQLGEKVLDPIYDQSARWLRDRVNSGTGTAGSLTLGLPASIPYSNTGKPLELTGTGVLLDGVPYTGGITWKDTVLGTGANDMVANLPLLYLDGKPLHWTTLTDGTIGLVNNDGNVVTDYSNLQTMPNDVIYVDGIPHAMTSTGSLVNLLTGDITANVPDTTIPGDVSGLWSQLWQWLKSLLDALKNILAAIIALPLKLIELLKAMLLALFVPSDGFWTDNMNNLKSLLWGDTIDDLTGEFGDLGNAGGGSFKDVIVSLMGVKDLVVIDADSVNAVLDYIHKWVRGVFYPFLLIYNINMLYKLIRGTSLVEVTRSMRYKAGD